MPQVPTAARSFFDSSTIPLVLSDARAPDNPIVLVNSAFCALTLYKDVDILGQNCRFLQGQDRDQPARHLIRRALEGAEDIQIMIRNYRRDGTPFDNLLIIYTVRDDAGPRYFLGSQFDITQQGDRERLLSDHALAFDNGVDRLLSVSTTLHIKTRRLLADSALALFRAHVSVANARGPDAGSSAPSD